MLGRNDRQHSIFVGINAVFIVFDANLNYYVQIVQIRKRLDRSGFLSSFAHVLRINSLGRFEDRTNARSSHDYPAVVAGKPDLIEDFSLSVLALKNDKLAIQVRRITIFGVGNAVVDRIVASLDYKPGFCKCVCRN